MQIHYFGPGDGGYPFDGDQYFTSLRRAQSAHGHAHRMGSETGRINSGDAVRMLEERDAEIARLRQLVPVSLWCPQAVRR